MEIVFFAVIAAVGFLIAFLGAKTGSVAVGGLSSTIFIALGLMVIFTGLIVPTGSTTSENTTAHYAIQNLTTFTHGGTTPEEASENITSHIETFTPANTTITKTVTSTYTTLDTNSGTAVGLMLVFLGLAFAFDVVTHRQEQD